MNRTVSDQYVIIENGYRILVTHGHQGDIFCRDRSCLSFLTCCASQVQSTLENLIDENLDTQIDKLVKCLKTDDKKITDYAFELAEAGNYNVVVFGHTHNQMTCQRNDKIYVNDGCVANSADKFNECVIDLTDHMNIENRIVNINEIVDKK